MFIPPPAHQLPPLSPQEAAKPYARFYHLGAAVPDDSTLAQLDPEKPIDQADALLPEQLNDLLLPGYLPRENGWCILPNGVGYAAALTKMPGVTPEMNSWWGPWHEREDLRYKLWCPGAHSRVGLSWAQEDVGMGLEDLYTVARPTADQFGFDPKLLAENADLVVVRCSNWLCKPAAGRPEERPIPLSLVHYIRRIPGGVEYRSRFWVGLHILRGRPVVLLRPGERIPPERACGLAQHCAYEMTTLSRLLPALYPMCRDLP